MKNINEIKKIIENQGKSMFDFPSYFPEYGGKSEDWMKVKKFFSVPGITFAHPLGFNTYETTFILLDSRTGSIEVRVIVQRKYLSLCPTSSEPDQVEYHNLRSLSPDTLEKVVSQIIGKSQEG